MKRVPQSEESLVEHLTEQVSFLCTSHKSFDDGFEGEAKRIAHILRVLLHDTRRSFSLLRQLGILEQFMYRDTSIPWFEQNSNGPVDGLTRMVISTEYVKPQAPLDDLSGAYSNCLKNFPNWWSQPVIRDNNDFVFTRRDLILNVANTDGGSHVDPALDAQYSALTRDNSMGWWDVEDGIQAPISAPHLPSVRQIAHELLSSLSYGYPDAFTDSESLADYRKVDFTTLPLNCKKPGRNDPCPCGSGHKYKKCHIKAVPPANKTQQLIDTQAGIVTPSSITVRRFK